MLLHENRLAKFIHISSTVGLTPVLVAYRNTLHIEHNITSLSVTVLTLSPNIKLP